MRLYSEQGSTEISISDLAVSRGTVYNHVGSLPALFAEVAEGLSTWRDAGSQCALLVLRGLGVPPEEAKALAEAELPQLAPDFTKTN